MININVGLNLLPKFYDFFQNTNARINVLVGGAGSGKSYNTALFLLNKFLTEDDIRILVLRKTMPSLRITAYKLILDILSNLNILGLIQHHKTFNMLKFEKVSKNQKVSNEIVFLGLDDPEKLKSSEFNYIWAEEATELDHKDFVQLNLRMRRTTKYINQMVLTFNPISPFHWLKTEVIDKPSNDINLLYSNYEDNPLIDDVYVEELKKLKDVDDALYKIYALGEWGSLSNQIYTNYEIITNMPETYDNIVYGLDFGYNNPSALVKVVEKDQNFFVKEILYQRNLTNSDLIERLTGIDQPVYCDSSEPARIAELQSNGIQAIPADKQVFEGIDFIKRKKIFISADSHNLIKEIQSYKWKEKDGKILDEPVKFNDHALDAMRYAIYTHFSKSDNIGFMVL